MVNTKFKFLFPIVYLSPTRIFLLQTLCLHSSTHPLSLYEVSLLYLTHISLSHSHLCCFLNVHSFFLCASILTRFLYSPLPPKHPTLPQRPVRTNHNPPIWPSFTSPARPSQALAHLTSVTGPTAWCGNLNSKSSQLAYLTWWTKKCQLLDIYSGCGVTPSNCVALPVHAPQGGSGTRRYVIRHRSCPSYTPATIQRIKSHSSGLRYRPSQNSCGTAEWR
jgi:hypothetical protein